MARRFGSVGEKALRNSADQLAAFVTAQLRPKANAENAGAMAAYMKTSMPFYGVKKPDRVPIHQQMKKRFAGEPSRVRGRSEGALEAAPPRGKVRRHRVCSSKRRLHYG
jgi:hypothetical protein